MLEAIMEKKVQEARETLREFGIKPMEETVRYPSEFDSGSVRENIGHILRKKTPSRILLDITGMPRKLVFFLLDGIDLAIHKSELYVLYTAAKTYPAPPSPAGVLQGVLSGKQLSELIDRRHHPKITAILVPSIYGIEVRQMLETIRRPGNTVREVHALVPLYGHDLMTGLEVLRKDSDLLCDITSYHYGLSFSFSMLDMARRILEITDHWALNPEKTLALIAPFNVKLLIVPSFYAVRELQANGFDADTILPSRTQYNSLYSLGTKSTTLWKIKKNR